VTRLRVEPERLAAFADRMALVAAQLGQLHADVTARTAVLDWSGAAATRHAAAQARWAAGAERLHEALAELRSAAAVAHANYLAAADANRRMWRH